jgi:hypothetical protein
VGYSSSPSLAELVDEIDGTPYGPKERSLILKALEAAQESCDVRSEYQVRLRLAASAGYMGDAETEITAFLWCLARHDADSEQFPSGDGQLDVLMRYRSVVGTMCLSPHFSLGRIDALVDDLCARHEQAGLDPSIALRTRFTVARRTGRFAEASAIVDLMGSDPERQTRGCAVCQSTNEIYLVYTEGSLDEAVQRYDRFFAEGHSCDSEPANSFSLMMLEYLKRGRGADALKAYWSCVRLTPNRPENLAIIANQVRFCAMTANGHQAAHLVERHLGWLSHNWLDAYTRFAAAAAFAVGLGSLERDGFGASPVRCRSAGVLEEWLHLPQPWTAGSLAGAFWQGARDLAEAFDARNGNGMFADWLAEDESLLARVYPMPLTSL